MADLNGKKCLILAPETVLSAAVHDSLSAAGAAVSTFDIGGYTEADWDEGLLKSAQRPSSVDAIINIAIPDSGGAVGHTSLINFRKVLEASYIRTWLALKYGILTLRQSAGGAFINVTCVDGKYGAPAAVARCAASNGIVQMTRSAAVECAAKKDNVRVNAVLVGDIMPGQHDSFAPGHVAPDDVASAVTHLASDAAIYITGLIMPVDNGTVTL